MRRESYTFDPDRFLSTIGEGRTSLRVPAKQPIFAQGDASAAVFYIQKGNVRLSVESTHGKNATICILGAGDFFGEGCLAGQPLRMGSATAVTNADVLQIDGKAMAAALHQERKLSELFVAYLLGRSVRYEEDLVDQLFNSSEKRLARLLLLLAHFGKKNPPDHVIPKISQSTLAEMVGTTRARINVFMNQFRKRGFIYYNGGELRVYSCLITVLLED